MRKVRVYGTATVTISTVVEVDNADLDEIIEKAEEKFGGINNYVGNGGINKLIGITGDDTIECSYPQIEFKILKI